MGPAAPAVWLGMERAVAGLSPDQSMQKGGGCTCVTPSGTRLFPGGLGARLPLRLPLWASIHAGGAPLALFGINLGKGSYAPPEQGRTRDWPLGSHHCRGRLAEGDFAYSIHHNNAGVQRLQPVASNTSHQRDVSHWHI